MLQESLKVSMSIIIETAVNGASKGGRSLGEAAMLNRFDCCYWVHSAVVIS